MTAHEFDSVLRDFQRVQPYQPFTIELFGGQRFEVDRPGAMVVRDGVAVFLAPGGSPIVFDYHTVMKFIGASTNGDS